MFGCHREFKHCKRIHVPLFKHSDNVVVDLSKDI